jgi:excisionase family DNA binding protein
MRKSDELRVELNNPVHPGRDGFATPIEAAHYLHLSKAMVHKLIGEQKIPACRYGRAVRIPWSWLLRQGITG